jgi:long-chain acyl-CoA synthetase
MLVHSRLPPLYRRFQQAAQRNPDKLALVVGESRQTYRELLKEVDALADGLANAGLRSGEHIGVLLPNCPEFVLLLLAGARLGSVIVPQSLGFSPEALANAFRAADIGHLVAWAGAADSLDPRLLAGKSILLSIGGAVEGWLGLAEILASGRPPPPSLPLPGEDLPYLLVLTSGATGNPKPIVLSQHTKCLRAEAAAGLYGVNADDVIMAATPPLPFPRAAPGPDVPDFRRHERLDGAFFTGGLDRERVTPPSQLFHRGLLAAEADSESPGQHGGITALASLPGIVFGCA